jgi:hypothetical protein
MDDTQTWMILLRKRWIRPRGRPGEKKAGSTFVLHAVTTMGRYIMSGSWEKHGMRERAEQGWRPLRRPRAPSSTVHPCLPYPAAAPLPRYFTLGNFLNNVLSGDFCFEADVPTLDYQQTRCPWLWVQSSCGGAVFSTLRFRALASCWKWRRNCRYVAWSWLGASHCCSHIIRLCTHAENVLWSYVQFLVQDFGEGFRV